MFDLRASVTLERGLQGLIVATVVAAVLAAGSIVDLLDEARKARWFLLFALASLALVYVRRHRGTLRLGRAHALAGAFIALAMLSASWSSDPRLTFARAFSLAVLFVACMGVTVGAGGNPESLGLIVRAVVAAGVAVALGGLLVLAVDHDRAIQGATAQEPARFQGLGGGPNTAAMVLAVAVPLAAHLVVEARSAHGRALSLAIGVLLLGSITASGSRGALLATLAGLLAYVTLATHSWRSRGLAAAAVAAIVLLGGLAGRLPGTDPAVAALPGTALPDRQISPAPGYLDADVVWRLQEDVGRPPWGQVPETTERSLLGGSGRSQAWEGAVGLAADRPALGYAFGLENRVFVDRYLEHGSNLPENSYVGLFLQLGAAGVALFAALAFALLAAGARAVRTSHRGLAAAATGGFVAGLALAVTQSFIYAAGNNATMPVWLCAFLLPAAAAAPDAQLR